MKRRARNRLGILIVIILVLIAAVLFWKRHDISQAFRRATLPAATTYNQATSSQALPLSSPSGDRTTSPAPVASPATPRVLPAEINLKVPFTVQAPHANWEPPYKEFCEEASVLMTVSYLRGDSLPTPEVADQKLRAIQAFEEERFGYYEDTTAAETAVILRDYFEVKNVQLLEEPTAQDLKEALAAGKLVILPAAGRLLGNPYYTPPGPLYHMLVIKGYTADEKFITNDPGTRRGADFLYSPETIMDAMHDWRADGNIEQGRKVVLIVG